MVTSKDIKKQTKEFLKSGGKVKKIKYGESNDPFTLAARGNRKLTSKQLALLANGSKYDQAT